MQTPVSWLSSYWWILALVAVLACYKLILRLAFGMVIIPDNSIGLVKKKFVLFGTHRQLPPGKIIALKGEAGIQADTLAPGLHFGLYPWQYDVTVTPFTVVPPGKIGLIESCDGNPLPDGRILARQVQCDNFQDARAFLENGGERGPQMAIMAPGTWRINTFVFTFRVAEMTIVPNGQLGVVEARDGKPLSGGRVLGRYVECNSYQDVQKFIDNGGERGPQMRIIPQGQYRINPLMFVVAMQPVMEIEDNMVGIVTTKDGAPLAAGEIAGSPVDGHNSFQDAEAFINNGGHKGLQEQVILAGRYFINPRFATVETVRMTEVPIAQVGVVIAYVGKEGKDVTGEAFKHGNLVSKGEKGVWVEPLDPGKYPINPYTHKVELVPTANIVLNWATGKTEAHKLDERLSTITVRSSDGFTFNLDVSQIIHVPRNDAPKVIARFGTMVNLVTQVLEPTIGNYFRNAAQTSDVIEFLKKRSERQVQAKESIGAALIDYNVNAIDTLIGDITPPAELMKTLTDRKLAEQEKVTYETQKLAEETRKELEQARAMAGTQSQVVTSQRTVEIKEFEARARVKQAEGEAQSKTINAKADAEVITTVGNAEAEKTKAVGTSEADVIKLKIESMESGNYAAVQIAQALAANKIKLVPDIMAGGGSDQGSLINVLIAKMLQGGAGERGRTDES